MISVGSEISLVMQRHVSECMFMCVPQSFSDDFKQIYQEERGLHSPCVARKKAAEDPTEES